MQSTSTAYISKPTKMATETKEYASSTFSESTAYSYDKTSTDKQSEPKRSFRQRVKNVLKDIGTSPFEYEDDESRQTAGWLTSLPPSKV